MLYCGVLANFYFTQYGALDDKNRTSTIITVSIIVI